MLEAITDPQWINAVLVGLAAIVTAFVVRGKTPASKAAKTAPHQAVVRPQTESEIAHARAAERQARALEQIAGSADKVERHLDMLTRSKSN